MQFMKTYTKLKIVLFEYVQIYINSYKFKLLYKYLPKNKLKQYENHKLLKISLNIGNLY